MTKQFAIVLLLIALMPAVAQEKKPEKKDQPQVLVAIPLGIAPGATTSVMIRGLKLDAATEIRFPDSKATAKIKDKGKAAVPDKNPEKVGDTQLVAEITLSANVAANSVSFVIVTPTGETGAHALLVESKLP